MATKNRTLELRAKFKDDASKNAKRVSDALKAIEADAKSASDGAVKSGAAFSGLAADLANLKSQAGKLEAFGTIAGELEEASKSVGKFEQNAKRSRRELDAYVKSSAEAKVNTQQFADELAKAESTSKADSAALAKLKSQLSTVTAELTRATTAQNALNAARSKKASGNIPSTGIGIEAGVPVSSARDSFAAFISADIKKAETEQARLTAVVKDFSKSITAAKAELPVMRAELRALEKAQSDLEKATYKAGNANLSAQADLAKSRTELSQIEAAAQTGSTALGGLAANQQAVDRATAKMNARIAESKRLLESYQKFATGSGDFADPQTAARLQKQNAAIKQAESDWKALEAEVKRLATELRGMSGDVTTQVNALNKMSAASRAAKEEYQKQVGVLHQLRGASQTTFAQWAQQAIPVVSATKAVQAATTGLANATNNATGAQQRLAPAAQRSAQSLTSGKHGADAFSGALLGVGKNGRQALSYMERLRGEIIALTLSYVGFQEAINQIGKSIEAFRTLEAVQSRLGVVFRQDTAKVAQEIDFLRAQADRLGISFAVLGDEYGKFAVAANAANFTTAETRDIFVSVAEAARVNKLSMDQMSGVFLALQQMISKGKVTSEELRRQLGDRLTGAFNIFADAIGVTTAELDEMMRRGEVFANRSNLSKFAAELRDRFGPQLQQALDTLSTDLGRFENSVFKAQLSMAQGLIPGLRSALQAFNDFASSAKGVATFNAIGTAAGKLISVLAQIPEYFDEIALFAKVFISLKLAGVFITLAGRVTQARAAFTGFTTSQQVLDAVMTKLATTQNYVAATYTRLTAAISTYTASQVAAGTATTATAFKMGAMRAALGLLSGALLVTANLARGLVSLLGGPIGIAITAITFAVGGWMTSVDDATKALSEHERQAQAVREAYQLAEGDADKFRKAVKGITLDQAKANLADLEDEFRKRVKGVGSAISEISEMAENWDVDFLRTQAQAFYGEENIVAFVNDLKTATDSFMNLEMSVDDYITKLDELGRSTGSEKLKELLVEIANLITTGGDADSTLVDLANAMLAAAKRVAALDGDISGLGKTTEETADKTEDFAKLAGEFEAATRKLKGEIAEYSDEMEDLEDIDALNKMYQDAVKLARTMGQVNYLTNLYAKALKEIENNAALRIFDNVSGVGGYTAALIKQFEGFQPTGKWDVNAYRAGYGSDTKTVINELGQQVVVAITEGMAVSREEAERDLARRLVEFQSVVKEQIGADRFASFGDEQQAVLTSLAYNYGSLPERILEAVRTGSVKQIAEAIRGLSGDNGGVNAGRRNQEAVIFQAGGAADFQTYFDDAEDHLETLKEQQAETEKLIKQNEQEIAQQQLINAGKEREAAIEAALADARADNPNITDEQLAKIREQAAAMWDLQNATKERELSEERVNNLYDLRQQLLEQQRIAQEQGDSTKAAELRDRISEVNDQLRTAIKSAIAMWRAIGGPEADKTIAKLQTTLMTLDSTSNKVVGLGLKMTDVQNIVGSFVDGLANAFGAFAQAIVDGENAFEAFGVAALQVLADVLRQVAIAIIKYMILNTLAGLGGPIGQAATALGGIATGHTGGVVGSSAIGTGNKIGRPQWASPRFIYHTGGIAGLAPDEVSATLRKGEEILTEGDPRHRDNLGGVTKADNSTRLKQVLAIGDKEIAQAMQGSAGEEVTLTHLKRNAAKIRRILGGN